MGQVHHHPPGRFISAPWHAIVGQAYAVARLQAPIGGRAAHVVRQPDGAPTPFVEHAQDVQAALGAVGVFQGQDDGRLALRLGAQDIRRSAARSTPPAAASLQSLNQVAETVRAYPG